MKTGICVAALALTLAVGCTTAIVRPYVGDQQAWPTSVGSIVNVRYDMPIFTSLPPLPYAVLAELRIESPLYAQPEERHMGILVKAARRLGGDALLLVDGQVFFGATYAVAPVSTGAVAGAAAASLTQVNRFNPDSFKPGVTVLAIKWTGQSPIALAKPKPAAPKPAPAAKPAPKPAAPPAKVETKATPKTNVTPTTPAAPQPNK